MNKNAEKEKINLLYCHEEIENGNFGDEISVFITKKLINQNKYELVINQPNIPKNIICLGSYLHAAQNNYYIYGTGIRTKPPVEGTLGFTSLHVCALRGPITYNFLTNQRNIKCPVIYGDPALLLKYFYKPNKQHHLTNKIAFIPHKSSYKHYLNNENSYDKDKFFLINPRERWDIVVDYIYSCKAILSSSLHGLIVSDAYNKPNLMLYEFELSEGDIKFKDYFISQKRKYIYIKKIENYNENKLYNEGNKINLEKLKNAFPFI